MKTYALKWLLFTVIAVSSSVVFAKDNIPPAPNGIHVPVGYKNWRVIGVAHRTDSNTLRAIVGNGIAVKAARTGHTNPWPEGTVFGKLVWKDMQNPDWDAATVPGVESHIEFMHKDSVKYKSTGGWGYARWVGMDAVPYGKDANFAMECFGCHSKVKHKDYVFTIPAKLP